MIFNSVTSFTSSYLSGEFCYVPDAKTRCIRGRIIRLKWTNYSLYVDKLFAKRGQNVRICGQIVRLKWTNYSLYVGRLFVKRSYASWVTLCVIAKNVVSVLVSLNVVQD